MPSLTRLFIAATAAALALAAPGLSSAKAAGGKDAVSWQPTKLIGGSPVLFEVRTAADIKAITASWFGHEMIFFHQSGNSWYGLAGIPAETPSGSYELRLTQTFGFGKTNDITRKIKIARAIYPKIPIKVAKQYTEPSPEQLTAIAADKEIKQKAFATVGEQRLWFGQFEAPVDAPISGVFGTERVFNQQVQSRHQGLDYAVPTGTPVHAVNKGTVILARPMFFEGNCVVIDHGQGLLSLYLHLSEIRVKEGKKIPGGQVLGLSGGTGRASGPHLHLAIRWQGIYLNPAILLKLNLPAN
jgi:murein DD-endopeptidase MepM/ murein hydrolase activator NlpD